MERWGSGFKSLKERDIAIGVGEDMGRRGVLGL